MAQYRIEYGRRRSFGSASTRITLVIAVIVLLIGARSMASYAIEVEWWKELGQFRTWLSMLYYGLAPVVVATILGFAVLWTAHARALKFADTRLRDHKLYARISALGQLGRDLEPTHQHVARAHDVARRVLARLEVA